MNQTEELAKAMAGLGAVAALGEVPSTTLNRDREDAAARQVAYARSAAGTRKDGWYSPLTGQGDVLTGSDKTQALQWQSIYKPLTWTQLASMYTNEDLSAKIVDLYPREALSVGYELGGLEGDEEAVTDYLERFDILDVTGRAWTWGRLFGGAAIWLGVLADQDPSVPLGNYERVDFLKVIDQRWLVPSERDDFGTPTIYSVHPPGVYNSQKMYGRIHASRLVLWPGALTEEHAKQALLWGWDFSVLQRVYNALRSDGSVWGATEQLIQEASIPVYRLAGFFGLAASQQRDAALQRYGLINRLKGLYRAVVLDKDREDFQTFNQTFAGIPDLTDRAIKRVAAAAEIPVSVLMGEAPAGLNATGDADLRWFLKRVASERKRIAEPRMKRLVSLLLAAGESPVKAGAYKPSFNWPSLWQATAQEEADIYLKTAQADKIYLDGQVVLPEELFVARSGDDGWSMGGPTFGDDARSLRQEVIDGLTADDLPTTAAPEPAPPKRLDWNDDQPRDKNGEFGSGGGRASPGSAKRRAQDKVAALMKTGGQDGLNRAAHTLGAARGAQAFHQGLPADHEAEAPHFLNAPAKEAFSKGFEAGHGAESSKHATAARREKTAAEVKMLQDPSTSNETLAEIPRHRVQGHAMVGLISQEHVERHAQAKAMVKAAQVAELQAGLKAAKDYAARNPDHPQAKELVSQYEAAHAHRLTRDRRGPA